MFQAPVVGQCFDMSAEEQAAPSYAESAVDCAAPHSSVLIAVVQMPDDLTYESRGLERFALETCLPEQRKVLGTKLLGVRLTAYTIAYFGPTPEQQAAGARWLRCDLVLGDPTAPRRSRRSSTSGSTRSRRRSRAASAGRDFRLVLLREPHTYRATAALKVDAKRFPSEKAWKRIGTQRCRNAMTSRVYRFGWPSKVAWKAGDRTLLCYSKTRR